MSLMEGMNLGLESNNVVSNLIEQLNQVCNNLMEIFTLTVEKVRSFVGRTIQGLVSGTKFLLLDQILRHLKMIDQLLVDIKLHSTSEQYQIVVLEAEQAVAATMVTSNFLKNTLSWEIERIFS